MRASGMDDVIFSGSGTRPARNTAEVTLFSTTATATPLAPSTMPTNCRSRAASEREAGSVYRINGKESPRQGRPAPFSPTSRPAPARPPWWGRAASASSSRPSPRRAGRSWKRRTHFRPAFAPPRGGTAPARRRTELERLEDVVGQLETQIENLRRQARLRPRASATSRPTFAKRKRRCCTCVGLRPSSRPARRSRRWLAPPRSSPSAPLLR